MNKKIENTKLRILVDKFISITKFAVTTDKWDRDDTYTDYISIGPARVVKDKNGFFDIHFLGKLKKNTKEIYVLYVTYDDGDSFGFEEKGCINFLGTYLTEEEALVDKEFLEDLSLGYYDYDEIKLPSGITTYPMWLGYFNRNEGFYVDRVALEW